MRRHWTPDEAYFAKLPKPLLVDALQAMGSRETGLETCKKGDLVPMAVRRAKASGWLPESVRFEVVPTFGKDVHALAA